jgi:hypothetical protein
MTLLGRKLFCVTTGEVFDRRIDVLERYPRAKYCTQAASHERRTAGGLEWAWIVFEGSDFGEDARLVT